MNATAILVARDTNNVAINKRLGFVNPAYVPVYGESIDSSTTKAKILQAVKQLNRLTTNTYVKTKLETEFDLE